MTKAQVLLEAVSDAQSEYWYRLELLNAELTGVECSSCLSVSDEYSSDDLAAVIARIEAHDIVVKDEYRNFKNQ